MTRMANRETSPSYVVRKLVPADVPTMVSIIETTRREYGVQRKVKCMLTRVSTVRAWRLQMEAVVQVEYRPDIVSTGLTH